MAILLPNKDGSSSAQIGDIVVTGGGIYEKTATGSVRRTDLESQSGYSGGVGNYNTLANTVYNSVRNAIENGSSSGGSGGNSGGASAGGSTPGTTPATSATPNPIQGTDEQVVFDANGIGMITGFSPYDYGSNSAGVSADTSNTVKNVLGYIVLGIIGLVLLDRAVGK